MQPKAIIVRHTGPEYKRFCIQAMERSVKSVELTCNRQPTTTTHDIPPVLARLPQDWEITEDLKTAWATVPGSLRVYTAILYRGLNHHTGTNLINYDYVLLWLTFLWLEYGASQ